MHFLPTSTVFYMMPTVFYMMSTDVTLHVATSVHEHSLPSSMSCNSAILFLPHHLYSLIVHAATFLCTLSRLTLTSDFVNIFSRAYSLSTSTYVLLHNAYVTIIHTQHSTSTPICGLFFMTSAAHHWPF
jgi:hypothetical protein